MLLQPLERPLTRGAEARIATVPFPSRGWNTRDKHSQDPKFAPIMTNIRPEAGRGSLRSGFTPHATGLPSADVETLLVYRGGATEEMFACVDGEIYDVTSAGAVSSAVVSSLSNNRWQQVMHGSSAGQFLVIANGEDSVRNYNGTTWSTPSITNVTSSTLIDVTSHQRRLWFIESGTSSLWYLGTYAISGAATELDLGPLLQQGGELQAIATWSYDGGAGPDDYLVAVSSQGEVVIYAGTDPSSANTWSLVGVYKIDRPLGRRCVTKYGADLAVLTESGVVLLSQVLNSPDKKDGFSDFIRDEFISAAIMSPNAYGWQLLLHSKRNELFANIPREDGSFDQFVHAGINRAWWLQTDIDAICWAESDGEIYFGGATGGHFRADFGTDDNDAAISWDLQPAWSRFGTSRLKAFCNLRANLVVDADVTASGNMKTDWDETPIDVPLVTFANVSGVQWDTTQWDVAQWAVSLYPQGLWATATGQGIVGAPRLRGSTTTAQVQFGAIDVSFTVGGII